MALRPLRPCKHIGCIELTRDASGYCDIHRADADQQRKDRYRHADKYRGSARDRGYDSGWEKVRKIKLMHNPLCEDCERHGRYTPAREVHHVERVRSRPDLRLSLDNLMSLCESCHRRRTAKGE